ncbi:hypothetical protein HPB48_020602 [Haemaphysalis longicornis]|uniref:Uncharacterized protein n=1 Tax=Haemaphysalis longicornis TaxID=44386 RepID=A0A9J6GXR5_HAELO|nr:hypothetical protein HPB48_020602 [Haemaphysalis longicornis]
MATDKRDQPNGGGNAPELRKGRIHKQVPRKCFLLDGVGHLATDCRINYEGTKSDLIWQVCDRRGHKTVTCRFKSKDIVASMVSAHAKPAQRPQDTQATGDEVRIVRACTAAMNIRDRMKISEGRRSRY